MVLKCRHECVSVLLSSWFVEYGSFFVFVLASCYPLLRFGQVLFLLHGREVVQTLSPPSTFSPTLPLDDCSCLQERRMPTHGPRLRSLRLRCYLTRQSPPPRFLGYWYHPPTIGVFFLPVTSPFSRFAFRFLFPPHRSCYASPDSSRIFESLHLWTRAGPF